MGYQLYGMEFLNNASISLGIIFFMKELRSKKIHSVGMGFSGRVVNNTVLSIHPHYVTIPH